MYQNLAERLLELMNRHSGKSWASEHCCTVSFSQSLYLFSQLPY